MTGKLDANVESALTVCAFEVVWLACPWIESIELRLDGAVFVWLIVSPTYPEPNLREVAERLLGEIADAVFPKKNARKFVYEREATRSCAWFTVIDQTKFVETARAIAPWRLELGR